MELLRRIAATRTNIGIDTNRRVIEDRIRYPVTPSNCEISLLPHQIDHANNLNNILDTRHSASDNSKPGLGKTYSTAWIARQRKLPAIVLCPKSMINTWHKVLTRAGVPIISITNYDMARTSHSDTDVKWFDMRNGHTTTATMCPWIRKRRVFGQKEEFEFIVDIPYKVMIIVDEEHTGKNTHTQTFSLLKGLKKAGEKQGHKTLYLSATPIEKKVNLKSILFFLGYVTKPDMNAVNSYFRKVIGTTDMADIHSYLYNREKSMASMPEPEFPEGVTNDVQALTYTMNAEKTARIASINQEIVLARKGLALKRCDGSIGIMNNSRPLVEKEKIDKFVELAVAGLNEYKRIGIFVNFKPTLHAIKEALLDYIDESEISLIYGELDNVSCDEEADKYVRGDTRVMIATIKKGGQSLSFHDTIGEQDTLVLISPPTSATDIAQCCGRHFRTECKSRVVQRIIFTAGDPIEESIRKTLSIKLADILTLTTGHGADFKLYDLVEEDVIKTISHNTVQIGEVHDIDV